MIDAPKKSRASKGTHQKPRGRPKTKPGPEVVYQKDVRTAVALDLLQQGWSYGAIADKMAAKGDTAISKQYVWRIVKDALDEARADRKAMADRLLDLELMRLDELNMGIFKSATGGNSVAITSALNIMDRRAKYLGLNAPTRTEITGREGGPNQVEILEAARSFDEKARKVLADALADRAVAVNHGNDTE